MINQKKDPSIEGETLELLKQLLQEGYVYLVISSNLVSYFFKYYLTGKRYITIAEWKADKDIEESLFFN